VGITNVDASSVEVNELKCEEKITMKVNQNNKMYTRLFRAAIAILAVGIAASPSIHAKPKSNKADKPANVVAHVPLSGGPVTRMLLVKKNGKEYLLLGLDTSTNAFILDVSEPSRPHAIDTAPGAAGAPVSDVTLIADTLAVFGTSDAESGASSKSKEIRSLSGVTGFMKDKEHGLLYVTNADGLWIIKTKQQADTEAAYDSYGS
jgi:hypothetical protein